MKTDIDPIFEMAKGMNDASRSGSNYGKLMLVKDIIMGLDSMNLGVESKATIKTYLENNKLEVKPLMIQPVNEIKSLGTFKVKINLHPEVQAEIKIKVGAAETVQ